MTPLLSASLLYAAGLLAGLRWLPSAWLAAVLLAALAAMSLRLRPGERAATVSRSRLAPAMSAQTPPTSHAGFRTTGGGPAGSAPATAALAAFCVAGLLIGAIRGSAVRSDCRAGLADATPVVLIGVPAALPVEGAATAFHARRLASAAGECRGAVRLRATERHMAMLDSAARGWTPALEVRGRWLSYPRRGGWPTPARYAGIVVVDSIVLRVDEPGAGAVTRFRTAQQARLRGLLPERWPIAEALLLAQKSGLTPETRGRWVAAGLVHLLAISGMHVGLIAAGALLLGTALGMPRRRARRLALGATAAYVLFLGAPTAALRALLQAGLLMASLELQRPAEPFTLLAAAGLAILLLEPMALLDPGFQLSFAGMVGLIGWRRPVGELLPARLPRPVRDGLAAGIAASALTTPIAALHFGQAAWIGIVGSIFAVPVLGLTVAALLAALVIAALTGATAGPHALVADASLRLLEWIAETCASVPGGHGHLAAPTVLALLAAAATAVLVRALLAPRAGTAAAATEPPPFDAPDEDHAAWARRHRQLRLRWGAAIAAALVVVAWAPLLQPRDGRIAIHAIDVGQGDAFAIETPRGQWVLVDAGPRTPRADAGRDRVVPFLLRRGVRRIDALVLTHPDADHIGGAAAVLEAFPVDIVIDPGIPAGKDMFIDLLAAARRADQRWIAGRAGIAFSIDGVDFAVLYPFDELDGAGIANDFSVVFRLEYGSFAALFLGDAPTSVEEELVALHGDRIRAAVLKVGHHGSATSTGQALLESARPAIALVSAGRRNRYGHPAPSVLHRLASHQVRVLRTDELGNITVRATAAGSIEVRAR